MLTLPKKLRKDSQEHNNNVPVKKVSIRDRLLVKEVQELQAALPSTCRLHFEDNDKLHDFKVTISPEEGHWKGGSFQFHIIVTDDYNFAPPVVKCNTKLWHPNINEDGAVCLSLLRQSSIDDLGWAPTRRLKDVVWGLNSLFTDLLNFEDPLNGEAAEQYQKDSSAFQRKVNDYIHRYCPSNQRSQRR
ncbi:unnamed protein product [Allacma fusca]|uniref:E2 NEDD8-conjugating enzyme n=1 Tax=Allacma fusca TaxID=39272 RepID=A0A8J2P365_9HEXA|nr:unnamed protein product [Allacma fusca]